MGKGGCFLIICIERGRIGAPPRKIVVKPGSDSEKTPSFSIRTAEAFCPNASKVQFSQVRARDNRNV